MNRKDRNRQKKIHARKSHNRKKHALEQQISRLSSTNADFASADWLGAVLRLPEADAARVMRSMLSRESAVRFLLPDPFPETFSRIGRNSAGPEVSDFKSVAFLTIHLLHQFKSSIKRFVEFEAAFQAALITGDLRRAEEQLQEVRSVFGESLWSIDSGLLVNELARGVKGNREYLLVINNAKCDYNVTFIANAFSQRVESSLSTSQYQGGLMWSLKDLAGDENFQDLLNEILFRLSFHTVKSLSDHCAHILSISRQYSMIDTFITFRRLVRSFIASDVTNATTAALPLMLSWMRGLPEFGDVSNNAWIGNYDVVPEWTVEGHLLLQLQEKFLTGAYAEVADAAVQASLNYPTCTDFLELAARAAAYSGEISSILAQLPQGSLAAEALTLLYEIERKGPRTTEAMDRTLALAHTLDSLPIGNRLMAYWTMQSGFKHPLGTREYLLATHTCASAFSLVHIPQSKRLHVAQRMLLPFPEHDAIRFLANVPVAGDFGQNVSQEFIDWRDVGVLIEEKKWPVALQRLAESRARLDTRLPLYTVFTSQIITLCVRCDDYITAANETVDLYLLNPHAVLGGEAITKRNNTRHR